MISHLSKKRFDRGVVLVNVLIFAFIAALITTALANWGISTYKTTQQLQLREQAFQIAEAGIEYYRWHLNYNATDYTDGNPATSTGPYVHQFTDASGNVIGSYALTITPPPVGSTIVIVKSTGTVASTTISRSIQASLAIPSLAKYAAISNDFLRFGSGTTVFGPIQSNNGIHFDGIAHNVVSSAVATFTDPDYGLTKWGVWTAVSPQDPAPPASTTAHSDVFMAGRQLSVPAFDFTGLTSTLSQLKASAQSAGVYLSPSSAQGYHIVLKTNDTFDVYKVTSLTTASNNCSSDATSQSQSGWGTWTINAQTLVRNYAIPANGIVFVEDNAWVDGQINTARITIAAGAFPANQATYKSITVNSNLLYTDYSGLDSIALISQNNINAGLGSANTLEIDGALVAQNGRIGRYYYNSYCGSGSIRSAITLYGMLASDMRYGFAYTDGTGYGTRTINYDGNMLYAPPPSFPLTSSQYSTIQWSEVK